MSSCWKPYDDKTGASGMQTYAADIFLFIFTGPVTGLKC